MRLVTRVSKSFKALVSKAPGGPKAGVLAVVLAGVIGLGGIAVMTTRTAGDQFANAAFSALGGDPKKVLDSIAQKVVDQLAAKGGSLDSAQNALVQELAGVAGKKLDGVNTDGLLDDVKGEVVAAGLGKLEGISTDGIISQVTAALIAEAKAEIAKLNLEQLAKDLITSVDIDKLVEEKLAKVDLNAIISKAVADQLGGSGSGGLGGLLGLLSAGR